MKVYRTNCGSGVTAVLFAEADCLADRTYLSEEWRSLPPTVPSTDEKGGGPGFDLIMFDPPFCPKTAPYKQIRKETRHKLKEIVGPSTREEFLEMWNSLLKRLVPLLKKTGWLIIKCDHYTDKVIYPPTSEVMDYAGQIIWDKGTPGLGYYIRYSHEILAVYRPKGASGSYFSRRPDKRRSGGKLGWHGGSRGLALISIVKVLSLNNGALGVKKKKTHINRTPPELWKRLLRFFCPRGGWVFDPFCGSASIGEACISMGINYVGIEIDPDFSKEAMENLRAASAQMTLPIGF